MADRSRPSGPACAGVATGVRAPCRVPVRRAVAAFLGLLLAGCAGAPPTPSGPTEPEAITFAPELGVDLSAMRRTSSGLYVQDLKEGDGFVAQRASVVTLRYVGYLPDGTVVDTTGQGEPFQFRLGRNEVIRGWNQGIPGMRVGGVRRLVVRPSLGYGSRSMGRIPPNTTLVFDVQLVDVR